jgi:hypothetical protein
MKKIIVLLIIIGGTIHAYAQNEKNKYLGGYISIGSISYSDGAKYGLDVYKDYAGKNYLTMGFDYHHRNSEVFEVCTGIAVTSNNMDYLSTSYFESNGHTSEYAETFFILSAPFHLRAHFLQYLFVDGGVCLNYHPNKGYTWGVGSSLGFGAEYVFESGITVSLSPMMQWNYLNFSNKFTGGDSEMDKLIQKGINIGVGYRF